MSKKVLTNKKRYSIMQLVPQEEQKKYIEK